MAKKKLKNEDKKETEVGLKRGEEFLKKMAQWKKEAEASPIDPKDLKELTEGIGNI